MVVGCNKHISRGMKGGFTSYICMNRKHDIYVAYMSVSVRLFARFFNMIYICMNRTSIKHGNANIV